MDIDKLYKVLRSLRLDNGMYLASTGMHYQKIWVRDTFYCSLPELKDNHVFYRQTYHTLLDYYKNMEEKYGKFTWLIKEPCPKYGFRYPHPRMTNDLDEINQEWGFKQLDCFGEFLYGIYLGESDGINIIRDDSDRNIINLIVQMLEAIEYWNDSDSGMWEENEEVHASSIGACLAGLTAIKRLGFYVKDHLLDKAHRTLNELLPKESITKDTDLALLTLVYPFNIIEPMMARTILKNVEDKLLKDRGVIRYIGDKYYNKNGEAEWCFGLAFLALAYNTLGDIDKAKYYLNRLNLCEKDGGIPELFYAGTSIPNDNNPLGWSVSMAILAVEDILGGE